MMTQLLQHLVVCGVLSFVALPLLILGERQELLSVLLMSSLMLAVLVSDWWFARRSRGLTVGITIFGALIPLAPLCGARVVPILTVLLVIIWYLQAGTSDRKQLLSVRHHSWILPLAALIGGSVLYEVGFVALSFRHGVYHVDGEHPLSLLRSFLVSHVPSLSMLGRILLFATCVRVFTLLGDTEKGKLRLGLLVGTVLCGLGVVLEYSMGLSWTHASRSSFWTALHRLSGSLSDPNALGLWMVLVPCATWGRVPLHRGTRALLLASYIVIPVAGLLSGSRTFLLGAVIALAALGLRGNRSWSGKGRTAALMACVMVLVVVAVASVTDLFFPWIDSVSQQEQLPTGVRRGIALLSFHRVVENFYSRTVFNQLGFELIRNFPFFGVGADRFRYYVTPLATALSIPIGRWVDNSNNFYTGIWSELGIVGVIAFLYAFRARRFVVDNAHASLGILVLLVLLVTGPHLDFPEIALLAAFLLAEGTTLRFSYDSLRRGGILAGVVGAAVAGFSAGSVREIGAYRCSFEDATCRQWITPAARVWMQCVPGEERILRIEAPHVRQSDGMVVAVEQPGFPPQELRFAHSGVQEVRVQCQQDQRSVDRAVPYSTMLSLWVRPGWSPSRDGTKRRKDERWLGVVVEGRGTHDLLPLEKGVS
jgi:hypothetical protein